ncbi:hypothetical protein EPN54_06130, partial [bacterium]
SLIDRHNLTNLTSKEEWDKTTYFNAYKTSFQQGEYNIKEPRSTLYGQSIRSYMSGGIQLGGQEVIKQIIHARPAGNSSPLFFRNNYIVQGLAKVSSAIDAPYHIEAININNMAQGATNLKQQPSNSSLQADTPAGSPVAQKQPAVAGPTQQPEKIKNIYGLISVFRKALFQRNERARFYGTRKQLIKMGFRPDVYEQALEYALGSKDAKMALRAISSLEQKFSTGEGNQSVETLKIIAVLAEPQIAQYAISSLAVALTIASTARAAVLELREIARCPLIEPQIAQYAISSLASALVNTVDFGLSEDIAYELFHLAQERRKAVRDEAFSSLKLALSTPGLNPKIYERIAKLFESLIKYAKKEIAQEVISFLESARDSRASELDPTAFKVMGYTLANTGWQRRGLIRRTSIFPLEQEDLRKKLAVIIHPIEDDNGAFKDIENKGKQLESRGYQVIIARVGGIDALLTALKAATARRRASVIMIGGHGSRTSIQLGFGEPDSKLTIRDKQLKEKLSAAVGTLEENGIIILDSCSTGKGGRLFSNIAQLFADTFPQGFVFTSPYPVVAEKGIRLIFNKENEVTAVEFVHAYWPKGYYNSVAKRDINSSGNLAIAEKVRNSEDSQNGAAGSPAAQTSTASPAAQESSASSPVQGTALVNLPNPQIQVITALQPDLNVSLSNEKMQFTIYKGAENQPGRLRIRQKDVMKENIAEKEFDAGRIFPLLSVGDKTLEKELRKDIARIIRESNAEHDKFYMNYSPDHWSRPQYKKMVEDFRSKGINLESYEGLEADIIKAFREAILYYSDAFGNVFGQEMEVLRYYQTSNRFLRLGHPIVVRLQKLLDKMAERGFPVARILVAIDGEEPLAFSIGQTVVINLALIMRLDTIDEVAAVLAHEQGHVEFNLARERGERKDGEHSFIEDISAGRLQEHGADLVTTTKLAKLGLYSLALSDVLRKIAGGSSQQDIVHGSISNRIVSVIGYHRFHDVEAGRSQAGQNMDIPDNWLLSTVTPSIKERIFNKKYGADFQAAVGEASYQLIEEAMNEFVRKLSYLEPKDNDYGEIAEKLLYVMNFCIDRISVESAKENWPRETKEAVVLSFLMNRRRSISWVKIYNKDVVSMQNPSAQEQIIGILRQPALFLLQSPDCVKILEELKGSSYMGQLIDAGSQDSSADFLAALLINDKWVTSQVIGNAYDINQKSYLTIFNTYLSRLVGLKQEHERKKWLGDWIEKIIGRYVENFWKNHERSKENFLMLTEHLKEANTEYAKILGLESVKDLQFVYNSHVLISGWSQQLYDAIINKVNISHTELINIIFGIQDDVLRECISVLKSKDEQLFFSFLNLYPMVFLEYLNSMDKREADPGLKKLFQDDPKLSEWLFSILSKQWATNSLKLPPDYRNDDFDKRWPNDEEKLLDYLEFTHYFRDDESRQKYKRFMFGLEAVKLLPVPDRERRFSMIKTYVNSGRAKLFLNGLPLRNMSYVIQDLEGIFKQNVGKEYSASLLDKRYEDKKLNFAVYWLLRDRLLSHIKPTVSLELAEKIYWFIGRYSNTVYGSTNLGGAIAGNSEAHSLWLLPVNKAYLNYLGERRDLAASFASPEISIRYYFALRGILPSGEAKERILAAFAKRLIEQLSDEHVVAFLTELSEKGDINREIYGHFVKKRVNTKDKFLYFKKYRDKYLQRLASVGSVKLLALMVGDNLVDMLLKNDLATEVFEAMLGSGKSDEELRKLLVTPWFFAMAAYGEGKQFKIEYEGGSVEVIGVGRGNFVPFSEFMDVLYDSPAPVKFMIMNKLLLSPKGVLQTQEGLKQFARIICKYLPEDGQLSDLLRSVLESSVSVIDAERLFLSLANSLSTIFLQKPEGGSDTLMAEALSEALAANIDRLNTWDVFKSFAADKLKKAKKDELGRFLRKYEKRIDHTEIVKRIEPLIDSLGENLEEELNIAPASKSSIPGGIAKYSTLEAIDIVLETCQSLGPVGVRFLQVLGQYLPLSPEYQDRFRDVYDAAEGQDKFTAWDTILKVSELDQEVAKFIEEDLVSIDETLGGGSIVTVFSDTVRNRDLDGNLMEGTHKEVLKIRNPNAEAFVNEVSDKAIKVIEHLENKASRADRKNYNIAKQLLKDIREWVIQDIRDTSFMELDSRYQRAHEDYSATNGMKVRVPPALRPNNKDIKREAYVEGVTLNKLLKLKLSGKSLEQLIKEEPDPEARRLLINLKKNTPAEEGATILSKTFREATRALVEDFSRHLVQPIFTREDGQDVYLLHSDIHPGNAILSPDAKTDYLIDRNFYLQLDKTDVEFIRKICTLSPDKEYELLNTIVGYFINLAENSNSLSRFSPLYKLRQKFMTMRIGVAIKLSGEKDSLANMVKILQVLESYNFIIPLRIRIMLKNLVSIKGMLKEAGAGEFSDYVLDAEQRYNNTAILSATEIKEAKNTASSPVAIDNLENLAKVVDDPGEYVSSPLSAEDEALKNDLRRELDQREKFGRILRDIALGDGLQKLGWWLEALKTSYDGTGRFSNKATLSKKTLAGIINLLKNRNPLVQILGQGATGDSIVVFQVPGVVREGFGIKDYNDILGYELTTDLINIKRKELISIIKKIIKEGKPNVVYGTYKDDVFLIANELDAKKLEQDILLAKDAIIAKMENVLKDPSRKYREKLEKKLKGGTHTLNDIKRIFTIEFGMSRISKNEDIEQARLIADINAHQALVMAEDGKPGIFEAEAYKKALSEFTSLLDDLVAKSPEIFDAIEENKETLHALKNDITAILRKQLEWEAMSEPYRKKFRGDKELYEEARKYFAFLKLQDYIKQWQVDFNQAKIRADKIRNIIAKLEQKLSSSQRAIEITPDMLQPLLEAVGYIEQEAKMPAFNSGLIFHSRAPPMEHPTYLHFDIRGLGLLNLREFELELQKLKKASDRGDDAAMVDIWLGAADRVTARIVAAMEEAKTVIMEQFPQSSDTNIAVLMGGDEFTVVINQDGISQDKLREVLFEVRGAVKGAKTSGLDIRICAIPAERINDMRRDFAAKKRDKPDRLAHAWAIHSLDKAIETLKKDEERGNFDTVGIQGPNGEWQLIKKQPVPVSSPISLNRPADGIILPAYLDAYSKEYVSQLRQEFKEKGGRVLPDGTFKIGYDYRWSVKNSSFADVESNFSRLLQGSLFKMITDRAKAAGDREVYVLDWGAGNLRAVRELSIRLKAAGINNVRIIAFGDTFYRGEQEVPDNAVFILDTANNLRSRLLSQFPGIQIDVIYSYMGMRHLLPSSFVYNTGAMNAKEIKGTEEFLAYLKTLNDLLSEQGFIVFDVNPGQKYYMDRIFPEIKKIFLNVRGIHFPKTTVDVVYLQGKQAARSLEESNAASSPVVAEESVGLKAQKDVGGIDMRSLPKYTKVEKIAGSSPLVKHGQSPSATVTVSDKEWQEIERMANSGIAPSCERLREYLLSLKDPDSQIDKVLACIAGILRQEEEKACGTESSLKEILILLESDKPANELRLALAKVEIASKEPQLIEQ